MKLLRIDKNTGIDLIKLIATKLFIYANSGFGKSWLLRWFLEQTFAHIQQIIIDPEGEFSTLREKFDYVLIGKGKDFDIQADPRSATLLAHRLLEEKVSAIIDLYELEPDQRDLFVANFTKALVNAPKNLWHPYLYVVDEAQDFAPEKGNTLSSAPLHSIAKKGRKRGCCPVFATQRVSDFSKSVIAACNNKLIGQASLDIDMKRCAAELGFTTKEQTLSLRDLDPGEFFAFGPAISKLVTKVKIGAVQTTHPDSSKMGSKIGTKVVPASSKVKKALAALADLPQAAAEEAKTTAELKEALRVANKRIGELERAPKHDEWALGDAFTQGEIKAIQRHNAFRKKLTLKLKNTVDILQQVAEELMVDEKPPAVIHSGNIQTIFQNIKEKIPVHITPVEIRMPTDDESPLTKGEIAVLNAIVGDADGITTENIAVLTGYKGTSRYEYIRKLKSRGLVEQRGDLYIATEGAIPALGSNYRALPTGADLREHWLRELGGGELKIFRIVCDAYPQAVTSADIKEQTGYQGTSIYEYLRKLSARKLIVRDTNAGVRVSDKLF